MNCEEMPETLAGAWQGELDAGAAAALAEHLAGCAACRAEAAALEKVWHELGRLPQEEPSPRLAERFAAMLARELRAERGHGTPAEPAGDVLRPAFGARRAPAGRPLRWPAHWVTRFAAVAATLAFGVWAGVELTDRRSQREMERLRLEVASLHETVTRALLAESSPSERLRGVAYGRSVSAGDERVQAALIEALKSDPNVNVRLAALEALRPLAGRAAERPKLVATVALQDSPLVQLSLLEVLLEGEGEAARNDLAGLVDHPRLDPAVRAYLRSRLGRSV